MDWIWLFCMENIKLRYICIRTKVQTKNLNQNTNTKNLEINISILINQ